MTQDEFDDLIQEIREEDPEQLDSEFFIRDKALKEDKLLKIEQKAGFTFPEEYRNFLKRFGAGEHGKTPKPDCSRGAGRSRDFRFATGCASGG